MRGRIIRLGLCLAAAAAAWPASAQDSGDEWDYGENPAQKLSIAAVTFDTFGVAVRCLNGSLSVVMSGLPPASGERTLGLGIGDDPIAASRWISPRDGTAAFALWPRSVAGRLSKGGRLTVSAPDGDRTRRYVVDLPPSESSVSRVFRACGQALDADDEDAAPAGEDFAGLLWDRSPTINFPDRAKYEMGLAAIQCRARASGGLRDCRVESEFPEGSGFGRAATLGAHQSARVRPAVPGENIEGRRLVFVVRYSMTDDLGPTIPSRLPPRNDPRN